MIGNTGISMLTLAGVTRKGTHVGISNWAKQARALAHRHSDQINAGIDKVAQSAKAGRPTKAEYIDKAAHIAKKGVGKP